MLHGRQRKTHPDNIYTVLGTVLEVTRSITLGLLEVRLREFLAQLEETRLALELHITLEMSPLGRRTDLLSPDVLGIFGIKIFLEIIGRIR